MVYLLLQVLTLSEQGSWVTAFEMLCASEGPWPGTCTCLYVLGPVLCVQVLHGGAHAMTARQLAPNTKGFTVVATQRSGAGSVPEAPHRLSVLSDQPLAPLAELPCGRTERFEGAHDQPNAALAGSGGAACVCMWQATQYINSFMRDPMSYDPTSK